MSEFTTDLMSAVKTIKTAILQSQYKAAKNVNRKYGKATIPKLCPTKPQTTGAVINVRLATAICEPIMGTDFRSPNTIGVMKLKFGNIGPLPAPISKNATGANTALPHNANIKSPANNTACEKTMIFQTWILDENKPAKNRPAVMPA